MDIEKTVKFPPSLRTDSNQRILLIDCDSGNRVVSIKNTDNMYIENGAELDNIVYTIGRFLPDVTVIHFDIFKEDCLSRILEIDKNNKKKSRLIIYSTAPEYHSIFKIMRSGISGFVVDHGDDTDLDSAINVVSRGGIFLSEELLGFPSISQKLPALIDSDVSILSERECQVVSLIADGFSTKEIAFNLSLSKKTVETYRNRIMKKLDIYSVAGLVKFAIKSGITSL